jgi:cellulose synthase (UDP-forming)
MPPTTPHTVDVFITTAGEPLSVIARTVASADRIDYPHRTLYVLDDSGRQEVADLARSHGARYLSRKNKGTDAKAGNLNFALAHSSGELILALDADQVPDPEILQETVGFADLPRVGFIQTRQRFLVPKGDPFSNEDAIFYEVMQRGNDTHNAAFSCGSGVLYRRAALESVGGFSTWNLVEDLHTSMRMHAKGWRSIYYDHALTTGTTPMDTRAVYRQRSQWALDSLRLLYWDNPFRQEGLSFTQRLHYCQVGFTYVVSGMVMPIFLLVPAWSLFTGEFLVHDSLVAYLLFRGIFFFIQTIGYNALNHPSDATTRAYRQWVGLFPVNFVTVFRALRYPGKRKPAYRVNRKPGDSEAGKAQWAPVVPHVVIIVGTIAGAIYGAVHHTLPWALYVIDVAWGAWVIWSLWGMLHASVVRKQVDLPPGTTVTP